MISPQRPTQKIRAPGNGGISVQGGKENIGIVDWTLNTVSLWKLKNCKINQPKRPTTVHRARSNTNRGVYNVIRRYPRSASGGLNTGRVPQTELLKQVRIVTEHFCSLLHTHEWRDRVNLGNVIEISCNLVFQFRGWMYARCFP